MDGVSRGLALQLPPLVAGRYAEWRPRMEAALMRVGIAARDYKVENPDWMALTAAVDQWEQADEHTSIAYALGRAPGATMGQASASGSAGTAGLSAATREARRGATDAVARGRRAYTLLYQTLSDDLRRLVAQVAQGDAYGLRSWLEKRFQGTEQDNVGDLWDKFTALCQADDEMFDEYKARVDAVHTLLTHAKDKPSAGLYAHRLLWKLSASYKPAVLALKASGKLKEAEKINWDEIVAFVNHHERSEHRLAEADAGGMDGVNSAMAALGARNGSGGRGGIGGLAAVECYNCGEKGHMARNCKKKKKLTARWGRPNAAEDDDDDEADGNYRAENAKPGRPRGGARKERASAVWALTSGSDEEGEERRTVCS